MTISEIVLSEEDLDAIDEIKAKADASQTAQKPQKRLGIPELGDDELDIFSVGPISPSPISRQRGDPWSARNTSRYPFGGTG